VTAFLSHHLGDLNNRPLLPAVWWHFARDTQILTNISSTQRHGEKSLNNSSELRFSCSTKPTDAVVRGKRYGLESKTCRRAHRLGRQRLSDERKSRSHDCSPSHRLLRIRVGHLLFFVLIQQLLYLFRCLQFTANKIVTGLRSGVFHVL